MKTIVHVLNTGSYSGAENVVITLIKQMNKEYAGQYRFIYMSLRGSIEERLEAEGIIHYPVEKLSVQNIKRMMTDCRPDLIHAHDYTASMMSAVAHRKIPVICHLHNNSLWIKKINIKSIAYLLTTICYRKILLVSEIIEKEYIFGSLIRKKTVTIGNPVDINRIREQSAEYKTDRYDIVFLGRMSEAKNPVKFIRIINGLVKRGWGGKAIMIGDGELRAYAEEEIAKLELQSYIEMKGFVENPYPLLKAARLMCVTSEWEGFGFMAVEALSLGVPVISTAVGGLIQIVSAECGRFCETEEEFVEEIKKLLTDTRVLKQLSDGAVRQAKKLNNIGKYIAGIKDIYDAL